MSTFGAATGMANVIHLDDAALCVVNDESVMLLRSIDVVHHDSVFSRVHHRIFLACGVSGGSAGGSGHGTPLLLLQMGSIAAMLFVPCEGSNLFITLSASDIKTEHESNRRRWIFREVVPAGDKDIAWGGGGGLIFLLFGWPRVGQLMKWAAPPPPRWWCLSCRPSTSSALLYRTPSPPNTTPWCRIMSATTRHTIVCSVSCLSIIKDK